VPKKALIQIHGTTNDLCVRTGKDSNVLDVQVGKFRYPVYAGEIIKLTKEQEVKNGGATDGKPSQPSSTD